MAAASSLLLLSPVLYLLFISAVHASESDALRRVIADLGGEFAGQRGYHLVNNNDPCRSPGITCERRLISTRVVRISMESRGLDGTLSRSIGRLSALQEVSLPGNLLSGGFPAEISGCRDLQILNLRGNALSGDVPREISYLVRLRALDLSGNQFGGDLGFLKHFPNLENLSLAHNLFSGSIPQSLSSFRKLRFFDRSGNPGLRGPVPDLPAAVEKYSLRKTQLLLPTRYVFLENSTNKSHGSGGATGKATGTTAGDLAPSPATSPATTHRHQKKRLRNWILGFFAGALGGISSGAVFSVLFRGLLNWIRGRFRKPWGPAIFSPIINRADQLAFLEKDDEIAALEVIGRGGCGEVYRAELPPNTGKLIAIKKIVKLLPDGKNTASELDEVESKLLDKRMRQLRSEIQTVGNIRHRNLLPLLAHVARPDCHLLVFEFMKNGSLHDALFRGGDGRELDWPTRHKIAAGIAAGLEYLHMQHSPRIIHRDLKPANILLDDDKEARITDFGLAKVVPDANTHATTSNVAGTVGFIAPEYHQMLKCTDKCDIYSFGVILAVLVLGKLPTDEFFQSTDEMSLVKWLWNVMKSENPAAAADPKLAGNGFEEQMMLVLRIACFCTVDDPKVRPNSKDVRCMLSQIKY